MKSAFFYPRRHLIIPHRVEWQGIVITRGRFVKPIRRSFVSASSSAPFVLPAISRVVSASVVLGPRRQPDSPRRGRAFEYIASRKSSFFFHSGSARFPVREELDFLIHFAARREKWLASVAETIRTS